MDRNEIDHDLERESRRILTAASERGIRVKLLGGMAIRIALGERFPTALDREYGDIDLFTTKSYCSGVESMLDEIGWEPESRFNALNGSRRLLFTDPDSDHKIDVFIDDFEMCHKLPLKKRFDLPGDALDPADLLLTKLQIIELNAKDRGDAYALLAALPLGDGENAIDLDRITELAAKDWGLQHTLELNLGRMREGLPASPLSTNQREAVATTIDQIEAALESSPKSRSWKLRDRIGERKRWYDEPEEIG